MDITEGMVEAAAKSMYERSPYHENSWSEAPHKHEKYRSFARWALEGALNYADENLSGETLVGDVHIHETKRLECAFCVCANEDGISEEVVMIKGGYSVCADHEELLDTEDFAIVTKKAKMTR